MIYNEVKRDLFTVPDNEYTYVHCIASDLGMGAGIAVPMNAKYQLRSRIRYLNVPLHYPTCVYTEPVFNLITKPYSSGKPTLSTLTLAVQQMKDMVEAKGIKKLAMPTIGCGLDRLSWNKVSDMLKVQFHNTDVEILVCIYP